LVLFATSAVSHITSPAFLAKLVFMGLAALNALWFEFTVVRSNNSAESGSWARHARLAGIFSLTLWALVIVTGRLIAYFPGSPV
ncbi:MAG TPA: hypothetical protein VM553_03730, partial [Dongiaceae bacterium]|nr:hypothetical protein [Dongiaceae bacterium]